MISNLQRQQSKRVHCCFVSWVGLFVFAVAIGTSLSNVPNVLLQERSESVDVSTFQGDGQSKRPRLGEGPGMGVSRI